MPRHAQFHQQEVQASSFLITQGDLFTKEVNLTQPSEDQFKANHDAAPYAIALNAGTTTFLGISFGT